MSEKINFPPRPWSVAPLNHKYYGTEILDADGNQVFKIWIGVDSLDDFSEREVNADLRAERTTHRCFGSDRVFDGWEVPNSYGKVRCPHCQQQVHVRESYGSRPRLVIHEAPGAPE